MSARLLEIYAVLGQQKAVRGPQDTAEASFVFVEGDTYRLRLNAQRPVLIPGSTQRYTPDTFSEFVAFEAALGQVDAAPTGGAWRIKTSGGEWSADLAHNIAPEALKTAIEALATVGEGKVEVTAGNAANIYIIRPTDAEDDFTFLTESSLVPLCAARVRKGSDGSGAYTVIKLHKAYFAFADQWTYPLPPEVTIEAQRTGSATKNATMLLNFPSEAKGSFELQHGGFSTRTMPVDGITAAIVEAALNELFADGATVPRFRCFDADSVIQIECIGPLAKMAVATLGIELYGQVPIATPEAEFALTELPMELFIAAKDKLKLAFEIVGIDSEGREHTLVIREAEIRNSLIDRSTSGTISAVATRYVTVTQTVDEGAPVQIGLRSSSIIATGDGDEPTEGEYEQTFGHNLNTLFPVIVAHRLLDDAPEKWEQINDDEFTTETISANATKIVLRVIPPEEGNVGSIKFTAINPVAGVWLNEHRHVTGAIDGEGDDIGKTLTQIIAEIRAAMPDGWPSVPGNIIADGSVTPEKLDITALAIALFQNAKFLELLRQFAGDAAFIRTLVTALATSNLFTEERKALFTSLLTEAKTNTELQTLLLDVLKKTTGFEDFIEGLVVKVLTSGAGTLPDGTIFFVIPAFDFAFPPANIGVANRICYDLLSPALLGYNAANNANIAGLLPVAGPGVSQRKHTATGDVWTRTVSTRRGRDLGGTGTVVTFANRHWYSVRDDATNLWPLDYEAEILRVAVSAAMLTASSRFNLAWLLQASLEGNVVGAIDLVAEIAPTGTSAGIAALTWSEIFRQRIPLSPALAMHQFSIAVNCDAESALTGDFKKYGKITNFSVSSANFAIRVRIERFDYEAPVAGVEPRGCMKLKVATPTAAIAAL